MEISKIALEGNTKKPEKEREREEEGGRKKAERAGQEALNAPSSWNQSRGVRSDGRVECSRESFRPSRFNHFPFSSRS